MSIYPDDEDQPLRIHNNDAETDAALCEMEKCAKQTLEDSDECRDCQVLFMSLPPSMLCYSCRNKKCGRCGRLQKDAPELFDKRDQLCIECANDIYGKEMP